MSMTVLDTSIANVALPIMAYELRASAVAAIWIVNAYQIAIIMALLPMASIGEIAGYRRVYVGGLALFVATSAACALAGSLPVLVLARFFQGLGAAAITGVNGALVRFTFPARQLGRAMGYNALVIAVSAVSGPTVAGILLSCGSWRLIFAVNILFGLLSIMCGYRCLPAAKGVARAFDFGSAALCALSLGGLLLGCAEAIQHGMQSFISIGAGLSIFAIAGAAMMRRAAGQAHPLVPLDLLRRSSLRLAYAASICSFAAQMAALVFLPFYLRSRFGFDHLQTGLLITSIPLGIAFCAPIAGRFSDLHSGRWSGAMGLCLAAVALAELAILPAQPSSMAAIIASGLLCGMGFGLFQVPNNRTMISQAPRERSGAAAGMLAVSRLAGQTSGALIVGLLFRVAGMTSIAPLFAAATTACLGAALSFRRATGLRPTDFSALR